MNGSEKQIKWAEDIKAAQTKKMNHVIDYVKNSGDIKPEYVDYVLGKMDELMNEAKFWIDNRSEMDGHSDNWDINDSCNNGITRRYFNDTIVPKIS